MKISIEDFHERVLMTEFLKRLETKIVSFAKSVLVDAELQKYRQSLLAAGLYSACLEIKLHELRTNALRSPADQTNLKMPNLRNMRACSEVWERLIQQMFGD